MFAKSDAKLDPYKSLRIFNSTKVGRPIAFFSFQSSMPRNNSNLLILSFIASILCCQCNKSKISDEDIVASLLYTLEKDSNLEIKAPYKIIHFENRIDHDQSVVSSHLLFDKKVITKISDQFKSLRRKSTRAGYGKNPSGWEYYLPMSSSEKYQYLIDTFNNQIVLHHQIYFDLQ